MSRRSLTILLSGVLAMVLTAGASAATVPYVAYQPGPTFDTLGEVDGVPVIDVDGREVFETEGRLDLTTISLRSELTLTEAVVAWLSRDRAVVPRELVFPPGDTDDEVRQRNAERLIASETAATTAALRQLGVPFTVQVEIDVVQPGLPAEGKLQEGDVITSVEGEPVSGSADLRDRVSGRDPGTSLTIGYVRDGATAEAELVTAPPPSGDAKSIIGVQLAEVAEYPFDVTITLKDVGGPSAGLMFALGILDKLGPESLTGGLYIAGTGEISTAGDVGAIGGISQKVAAAQAKGADAFLVPEGNCEEARGSASDDGITLVRVATLQEALDALETLRDGGTPPTC